ncbi:CPBP family intramembrane glutamic endopeptidase [Spirosoma spitsbergense]|uniref:CPBP family intramembrane glutamic endopeptidase n=1 Tax=Spirosoma spitsbergense TaxID=431554 RepID=UPI00039A2691|nr:CPBP family intramembrane glutamic endopeptidase [Spirosoma spitsbergense]
MSRTLTLAEPATIKPLTFPCALLYFGLSALGFRICVYELMPYLIKIGVGSFAAFIGSYSLALVGLMLAAVAALYRDGFPLNQTTFQHRLRFKSMAFRAWCWTIGLFLVGFLLTGLLIPSAQAIARLPTFQPPPFLPDILNPLTPKTNTLTHFMGVSLAGQWWVLIIYGVFLLVFNLLGEEIWFRGYLLPRQQIQHGRWTWLIHGFLWTLFHLPIYPWYLFYLLPTALTVSYAAQKTGSSWASYLVHGLGNGLLTFIPLTMGILSN